ncbi:MAG: helix-turn-helix domain-containing protein [Syntrophomonadaceae bacterium]|nr:helix-turn-helix domain-containing protein [Syntrophomonadaceae bacterium]
MEQNVSYTPEEVAQILKVSKYTVYEMVKRGDLVAYRIGRNLRIQDSDIEEYIAKSKAYENNFKGIIINSDGEKLIKIGDINISLVTDVEGEARVAIDPEDIILAKGLVQSSARNVLKGIVKDVVENSSLVKIIIDIGLPLSAIITYKSYKGMQLEIGQEIYAIFKSSAVKVI